MDVKKDLTGLDFKLMKVAELREIGKALGFKYIQQYNKEDLIEELEKKQLEQSKSECKEVEQPKSEYKEAEEKPQTGSGYTFIKGVIEIFQDGYGFLRVENYIPGDKDAYVSPSQIRRFRMKTGDEIEGYAREANHGERYRGLIRVEKINGKDPEYNRIRKPFEDLTAVYPNKRLRLENGKTEFAMRMLDFIAPLGKGQRAMIVSPPKAGKTTLLKMIAKAIETNHPDIKLIVLLIDERPEEVSDIKKSIKGEVVYSTFDEVPENHIKISELVIERAKRLVEANQDVVILLDSLTRLARAYNNVIPPSGRTLSGGLDAASFYQPKKFFGAARNMQEGGSLTVLATALVDTGSRMDDVIFEEFKGTGNMEIHLSRDLSEKRIFPAIDIYKSGTRKEELLLEQDELEAVWRFRNAMRRKPSEELAEEFISALVKTNSNMELIKFLSSL